MRAKSTLQLRHQLTCNGITIQKAAYDTRRHHVLTADVSAKGLSIPPMLRLFSLRRELKCVPLSDVVSSVKNPPPITIMMLEYAPSLDIFLCMYVVQDVYTIVFLETVSLRQLVSYPGPKAHLLRCVHYDDSSSRILLAVRIRRLQSNGTLENADDLLVRSASSARLLTDHLEFLQLSRRSFQSVQDPEDPKQRLMLCIEKYRTPVLHPDSLMHVVGSPNFSRVYGAGASAGVPSAYDLTKTVSEVFVMEWEDANGVLVLVRRAVLAASPLITSLALSTTGDWLFTGHANGQLKVWHVQDEGVGVAVGTSPFALGSTPIETPVELDGDSDNSIQKIVLQQVSNVDISLTETMLFTVNQARGSVKHWRFELLLTTAANFNRSHCLLTDLQPRLKCMGGYDVPNARKQRVAPSPISLLSVKVDMGGYIENLVLLLRADVLNVLKVQCMLDTLLSLPSSEDCFAIRRIDLEHGRTPQILCLSGTQVTGVRLLAQHPTDDCPYFELVPPKLSKLHSSSRVSAIYSTNFNAFEDALAIYGWNNGAIEVYSLSVNKRLALLSDSRVNESISAVYMTQSSSKGSPRQSQTKSVRIQSHTDELRVLVCAGTATAQLVCWEIVLQTQFQTVEHAKSCVNSAHSSHVVQLAQFDGGSDATLPNKTQRLLSLGSDGVVKLWTVPSMTMSAFVSASNASSRPATCMESVLSADARTYLAVGCEDGTLAVWCMRPRHHEFESIPVTARHERRISALCKVPAQHCTEFTQLVTCSLDMTVILWKLGVDGIHEHRYFEIGAPVISVCVMDHRAVAALAHEVCTFRMFNDCKTDTLPTEIIVTNESSDVVDKGGSVLTFQDRVAPSIIENETQPKLTSEECRTGHTKLPVSLQSAGSYIHIPSVQLQTDQSVESDTRQPTEYTHSGLIKRLQSSGSAERELGACLGNYMNRFGESGKMSIDKLIEFTKVYHIPIGEHPRTTILKHLKRLGTNSTELTMDKCIAICQAIYHSDSKAARLFTRKQFNQKRRDARKQYEHEIARRQPIVSYNCLGEKTISYEIKATDLRGQNSNQIEDLPLSKRYILDPDTSLDGDEEIVITTCNRKRSIPDSIGQRTRAECPDGDLLHRLSLSMHFRAMWSKGACWCNGNPCITVIWNQDGDSANTNISICPACRKKQHSVHLQRETYRPHFSLRMILGIIAQVYDQLAAPSHSLLFARMEPNTGSHVSVHDALGHILQQQYGMQDVVEIKLKLLFVSMCHFVREIDAVAVFGELLGVFAPGRVDTIPSEMVALCVCCYAWLYSREMVINGDAMIGPQRESNRQQSNLSLIEIENGKRTNWQFVQLQHAALCAQEILLYPLVSPGYLHNILLYMGEYSQPHATFPIVTDDERAHQINSAATSAKRWIEIHRFLRLLVGEWKEQSQEFYSVKQSLFVLPLVGISDPLRIQVVEKLRLLLNCFIVYDHERLGVMEIGDFDLLLRKLRYLWPNEQLTLDEAAQSANGHVSMSLTYENTIHAAKQRFGDTEWDGRLCYLDFWAMLYIVGLKNNDLLKFREIPGFCRDYKLEIVSELRDMVTSYMKRSSSLLLPDGSHVGRHSLDQLTAHQHRRRVGGLHDGLFVPTKTLRKSFSLQNLVTNTGDYPQNELYLEGSIPVLRQSASTSAMSRFQPVSHGSESHDSTTSTNYSKGPVVVGIRLKGVKAKQATVIRAASFNHDLDTLPMSSTADKMPALAKEATGTAVLKPRSGEPDLASNVYIQFPHITPQYKRMLFANRKNVETASSNPSGTNDDSQMSLFADKILHEHAKEEAEMVKRRLSSTIKTYDASDDIYRSKRKLLGHFTQHGTLAHIDLEHKKPLPVSSSVQDNPTSGHIESPKKAKSSEVVVVPTIEKNAVNAVSSGNIGNPAGSSRNRSGSDQLSKRAALSEVVHLPVSLVREESFKLEKWPQDDVHDTAALQDTIVPSVAKDPTDKLIQQQTVPTVVKPNVSTEAMIYRTASHAATEIRSQEGQVVNSESVTAIELPQNITERQPPIVLKVVLNPPAAVEIAFASPKRYQQVNIPTMPTSAIATERSPVVNTIETAVLEKSPLSVPDMEALDQRQYEITSDSFGVTTHLSSVSAKQLEVSKENESNLVSTSIANELLHAPHDSQSSEQSPVPEPESVGVNTTTDIISMTTRNISEQTTVELNEVPKPQEQTPECVLLPAVGSTEFKQRHTFRFSQQPGFLLAVSSAKNRNIQSGLSYDDYDSDSDHESSAESALSSNEKPRFHFRGDAEEEDDGVPVEDVELLLSKADRVSSKQLGTKAQGTRMRSVSTAKPSSGKHGKTLRAMSRELESVDESAEVANSDQSIVSSVPRRNEQEARAHYGEREENTVCEGIVFSSDAEEEMAHKWEQFFGAAEYAMFTPLIKELEEYKEAQRTAELEQTKLMKKRLDQQTQDNLRLQQSRRSSSMFLESNDRKRSSSTLDSGAAFRLHRMARESCQQTQTELQYGMSVNGQCKQASEVEYFHFCYRPETDGSILTVKLHMKHGNAHVFLSTQTMVPCATDFMWRSSETMNEVHEGRKVVLYPRELMKALSAANNLDSKQETITSMVIYLAVISSEPMTSFTLGVMTSGHRTEHSQAIRNVDSLIDRFSQLAKTFSGTHAIATVQSTSSLAGCKFVYHGDDANEPTPFARRRETRNLDRINSSCTSFESDDDDDNEQNSELSGDDGFSSQVKPDSELGSFQQLLESIGDKHGSGKRTTTSFLLAGPSSDHYEFIHDERLKLSETTQSLSPVAKRNLLQKLLGLRQFERDEDDSNVKAQMSLERRLARFRGSISSKAAKAMKKHHRLSPLQASKSTGALVVAPDATVNVQVARFAPKPVAYSLSTLPRPSRFSKQ